MSSALHTFVSAIVWRGFAIHHRVFEQRMLQIFGRAYIFVFEGGHDRVVQLLVGRRRFEVVAITANVADSLADGGSALRITDSSQNQWVAQPMIGVLFKR